MPNLTKMTARQNAQYYYMMDVMRRFEWDMHNRIEQSGRIPSEWHDIAKERPERVKVQVNIGLDQDVLKFFKSLGKGYGAKINLILKSFMHARLAGVLEGAETVNHFKTWELRHDEPKPEFGFLPMRSGRTGPTRRARCPARRPRRSGRRLSGGRRHSATQNRRNRVWLVLGRVRAGPDLVFPPESEGLHK